MNRVFILTLFIFGLLSAAEREFYLGINPLAPMNAIEDRTAKLLFSIFSNAEYGLALNAGCVLNKRNELEARLILGSPHGLDFSFMPQLHAVYNFFLRDPEKQGRNNGFYLGANLRFWDMYYRTSRNHYFNLAPAVDAGYMWNPGKLFIDLRANQMFAVLTWSNQEHTSPAVKFFLSPIPEFSPVVGFVSVNVGYRF
jgi:hypothetical protein